VEIGPNATVEIDYVLVGPVQLGVDVAELLTQWVTSSAAALYLDPLSVACREVRSRVLASSRLPPRPSHARAGIRCPRGGPSQRQPIWRQTVELDLSESYLHQELPPSAPAGNPKLHSQETQRRAAAAETAGLQQ
jgi:hypothetical protein